MTANLRKMMMIGKVVFKEHLLLHLKNLCKIARIRIKTKRVSIQDIKQISLLILQQSLQQWVINKRMLKTWDREVKPIEKILVEYWLHLKTILQILWDIMNQNLVKLAWMNNQVVILLNLFQEMNKVKF